MTQFNFSRKSKKQFDIFFREVELGHLFKRVETMSQFSEKCVADKRMNGQTNMCGFIGPCQCCGRKTRYTEKEGQFFRAQGILETSHTYNRWCMVNHGLINPTWYEYHIFYMYKNKTMHYFILWATQISWQILIFMRLPFFLIWCVRVWIRTLPGSCYIYLCCLWSKYTIKTRKWGVG